MENISVTLASDTSKKPIHAYVKCLRCGAFNLYTQTGNALPVYHSQHYCFSEAKEEALKLGAVNGMLVQVGQSAKGLKNEYNQHRNHDCAK
ncbi:MAG TPA: hypothetical protein DEO56_03475 [Nitrosomonas nitrosa]|nr:hypothetical protein [Nitrosomonas nitrosa]HBZ29643.1 hypothetical protein [Nitrosomonas nitrosa]